MAKLGINNKLNKFTGMLTEYIKVVEADSPALQKFGEGVDNTTIAMLADYYTREGRSPEFIFNELTQVHKHPVDAVTKVFNNLKLPVPGKASPATAQANTQKPTVTGTSMPIQQSSNTNPTNQVTSQANTVTTQPTTARPQATSNNTSNYSSFKRAFDAEPKFVSLLTKYFNEPNEESLIKKINTLPAEYQKIILKHTQTQAPWDTQKFIELLQSGKLAAYRQSTQPTQAQPAASTQATKLTAQPTQAQPAASTQATKLTAQPATNIPTQALAKVQEIAKLYSSSGQPVPKLLLDFFRELQNQSSQPVKENQEFQKIIKLAGLK